MDLIEREQALHCAGMDSEIYIAINNLPAAEVTYEMVKEYCRPRCLLLVSLPEMNKLNPCPPNVWGDSVYHGEVVYDSWDCPACGETYEIEDQYDYCPHCGQKINWKGYKGNEKR